MTIRSRFRRFAATMRLAPEQAHTTADLRRTLRRMAGQPTTLRATGRKVGIDLVTGRAASDSVYIVSPGKVEKWKVSR